MIDVLQIHPDDNVCVAVRPLTAGSVIQCGDVSLTVAQTLPLGAKIALRAMKRGEKIFKFGEPIGSLSEDVGIGAHVHTHNLESDYLPTHERGDLMINSRLN